MRERLADLRHILRENAADLFPAIVRQNRPSLSRRITKRAGTWREKVPRALQDPPVVLDSLDIEALPEHLDRLAEGLSTLLASLNEFPEFNDETMNSSINSFEKDLKV